MSADCWRLPFIAQTPPKSMSFFSAERSNMQSICLDCNGTILSEPDDCPLQHSKRISEFVLSSDKDVVDPLTVRILFSIEWPGQNLYGGALAFRPDGYLYIGLGDGGWVHGPTGDNGALDEISPLLYIADLIAQDLTQYFGKILRIDVDGNDESLAYQIPEDNPFVGNDAAYLPEIYVWGFRNPFRISFDRNDCLSSPSNAMLPTFPFMGVLQQKLSLNPPTRSTVQATMGGSLKRERVAFSKANSLFHPTQ